MNDLIPLEKFTKKLEESGLLDELRATMENRDYQFEHIIPYINQQFDCSVGLYTSACPVQVQGEIDGHHVYFRARWTHISLEIGDNFQLEWVTESDYEASWLPPEKVGQYLFSGFTAFRNLSED